MGQPMVEKPMKVPISRTVCLVNIVFVKSRRMENIIRESREECEKDMDFGNRTDEKSACHSM